MREILFRGFTPDENGKDKAFVNGEWIKGQWVQGSYWELNKTTYCFKEDYERDPGNTEHYIVFDQMTDWGLPNRHLQAGVLPETVGQYTGTNVGADKLFEGDIVEWYEDYDDTWGYGQTVVGRSVVVWDTDNFCWAFKTDDKYIQMFNDWNWNSCYIIGNIHDNPELLKGEEEDE